MNCEANGCTAALEPKSLPGSAMGGPSPWVVTDIPAGWCVRYVENVDIGSGRLVVLCPVHSAGVAPASVGIESVTVSRGADGIVGAMVRMRDEPAVPELASRIEVLREVVEHLRNCGTPRDYGEYQVELEAEIGFTS